MKVVSTKLSDSEHDELLAHVNAKGETVSEFVRELIIARMKPKVDEISYQEKFLRELRKYNNQQRT